MFFAACADNTLWKKSASEGGEWVQIGAAQNVVDMTVCHGQLYAAVKAGEVRGAAAASSSSCHHPTRKATQKPSPRGGAAHVTSKR